MTRQAFHSVTHAKGAGESGLARLLELHLVSTLADALVATALASTIFFAVPTGQARARVATSLLVTMVPFVVLAPAIGPMLDRVRHGRRYTIAVTLAARAVLALMMARAVGTGEDSRTAFSLYPAAFGFLVGQKAYIVARAAAVPRVLPVGSGLVAANARLSLAGVAAMSVGAVLGIGITALTGPSWTLWLAFIVFGGGTVLSFRLSSRVDSSLGEVPARLSGRSSAPPPDRNGPATDGTEQPTAATGTRPRPAPWRRSRATGPYVVLGVRVNVVLRAFTGFLTLFLAFRLRTEPLDGLPDTTAIALVVALAAAGGGVGTVLGERLRRIRPEPAAVLAMMLTSAVAIWAALSYGLWPVLAVAAVAGAGQSLGKLCLDAMIQRDVGEDVRTSAFARSETMMQLAWVGGGGIGLALPLSGAWGLGVAAATVTIAALALVTSLLSLPSANADRAP
jgi:nitrate reductase NapE component